MWIAKKKDLIDFARVDLLVSSNQDCQIQCFNRFAFCFLFNIRLPSGITPPCFVGESVVYKGKGQAKAVILC